MLGKSVVSLKLLHLEYFVLMGYSPTFGSAVT